METTLKTRIKKSGHSYIVRVPPKTAEPFGNEEVLVVIRNVKTQLDELKESVPVVV